MRFWISGPRVLGHRTGISLGPEDFRRLKQVTMPNAPERRPSAFVYVIRGTVSGHVKIGMGADPRDRLAALQTGSHEPLALVYACAVRSNNAAAVEAAAHDILRNSRLRGDWFSQPPEIAVAAIAAAAHKLGDPIVEIPADKIGTVLEIAAQQDVATKPRLSIPMKILGLALLAFWVAIVFAATFAIAMAWKSSS